MKQGRIYKYGERSLLWALLILMLLSWVGQLWTGWEVFVAEAAEHNTDAAWIGRDGYLVEFFRATFENWQSEFLQLATFVFLSKHLIFKGSPQSRDGDDEMKDQLDRIENAQNEMRVKMGLGD